MKKGWFNSILSKKEFEHRCGLSKSMDSIGPIENFSRKEDPSLTDTEKSIPSWRNSDSSSYSNVDHLIVRGRVIPYILILKTKFFEIDNYHSFLSELQSSFSNYWSSSYLNSSSKSGNIYDDRSMYYTKDSWNNHINNCIDSYLHSQICIRNSILSGSDNDSYILSHF
ncbi:Acetyl-coenzyme A carboxylase carboxyl transferase subunit beta chloroplastic [Bienertia sinuspersici]